MRIAVPMGGDSGEREVSLASGTEVARALRERGHDVLAVDTMRGPLSPGEERRIREAGVDAEAPDAAAFGLLGVADAAAFAAFPEVREADVLFLTLHGGAGEDGRVQSALEIAGLPYTGSGPLGSAIAMDKDVSKRLARDGGLSTPAWLAGERAPREVVERLGLPLVVKPVSGGSTLGITLVREAAEIEAAVALAKEYRGPVMYEAFVPGREMTVGILEEEALPLGEIVPEHEIFDYECKYQPGMAREIFPAEIESRVASRIRAAALRAHRLLRLRDFSRIDFLLDEGGIPWFLEANSLPGLTAASLVPKAAAAAGLSFPEFCERLASLAFARSGRRPAIAAGKEGVDAAGSLAHPSS